MSIRSKLIVLILGIVVFLGAAGSLYFVLVSPVDAMESEKSYFLNLVDAIKDETIHVNRLLFLPIVTGETAYKESASVVDEAFNQMEKVKILPRVNTQVQDAIISIKKLRELNTEHIKKMNDDYAVLKDDATALVVFNTSYTFDRFYTDVYKPDKKPVVKAALAHLATFKVSFGIVHDSLIASVDTIEEQFKLIDHEISAARTRALRILALSVVSIVIITVLLALLFAGNIARSIIAIERNIAVLKEGDLTQRSKITTRDEIGTLAGNLNLFLDMLTTSFLRIKEVSKANIDAKDKLVEAGAEATSATTQIQANAVSIENQIETLDARIMESTGSIGKIGASITELNMQVESQNAMVEEATASVTEMLSSLESMSRITEKNRTSADELVSEAERGRRVFAAAFGKIGEIPKSIGTIREMAGVIQDIASQTNLLAMNAAIEAAHAGEAGRGFAVVADEIRKLSEASTKSSHDISESIKMIVKTIDEASVANVETTQAFAVIDTKIREVSRSITVLYSSISEIRIGSEQILSAMVDLQERSLRVKEGSRTMDEGSIAIKSLMNDLGRISSEVTSNISEITAGLRDIGTSIRKVAGFSENVGAESAKLDEAVNSFRTTPINSRDLIASTATD
jgi:methyl-accepting chemotaxis protein